jgi:hypothetical protein
MITLEVGSRNRSCVGTQPGRLAVAAPPWLTDRPGRDQLGQVPDRRGHLVGEFRRQHDAHSPVQLGRVQTALRVVLAQQANDPLPVGLARLAPRPARHRYRAAGSATTAVP